MPKANADHTPIPLISPLHNLSLGELVDQLGHAKAEAAEIEVHEKALKDELIARGVNTCFPQMSRREFEQLGRGDEVALLGGNRGAPDQPRRTGAGAVQGRDRHQGRPSLSAGIALARNASRIACTLRWGALRSAAVSRPPATASAIQRRAAVQKSSRQLAERNRRGLPRERWRGGRGRVHQRQLPSPGAWPPPLMASP
jgi:hypothetical protein